MFGILFHEMQLGQCRSVPEIDMRVFMVKLKLIHGHAMVKTGQ